MYKSDEEYNKILRDSLYVYSTATNYFIDAILKQEKHNNTQMISVILLQSIGSSLLAVYKFTEKPGIPIKDAYIIMRSVIETIINLFLVLSDEKYADKAYRHAIQKKVRMMNRRKQVGLFKFEVSSEAFDEYMNVDEIKNAYNEFDEYDNWSQSSIVKRIQLIEEKFGKRLSLSIAYFAIYSDSSELIHGSFYGIANIYGWGEKDKLGHLISIQTSILFHAVHCMNDLTDIIDAKYKVDKLKSVLDEVYDECKVALKTWSSFKKKCNINE